MDGDNFNLEKLRFKTEISGDNSNRFRREKFRAPVVDGADGKERDDEKERRNALKTKGVPECSRGGWLADGEDRREVGH